MTDARPYSKETQLARGERRYRRTIASPKQWQQIIAAKGMDCRLDSLGCDGPVELHHLVARAHGGGDVADNIVPLCRVCHAGVTDRRVFWVRDLCASLTDAEYAYAVGRGGDGFFARAYGLEYHR